MVGVGNYTDWRQFLGASEKINGIDTASGKCKISLLSLCVWIMVRLATAKWKTCILLRNFTCNSHFTPVKYDENGDILKTWLIEWWEWKYIKDMGNVIDHLLWI